MQKQRRGKKIIGDIYIFLDNGNNAYKIGFTTNLKEREKQHKTSNPFLELIKVYSSQRIENEQLLHQKLRDYQIKGTTEWYVKKPQVLRIKLTILKTPQID
jgi:predicted GIY-YIG superfamily endonuclease